MIKRLSLVVFSFCLMLGFQNCARTGTTDMLSVDSMETVIFDSHGSDDLSYVEVPANAEETTVWKKVAGQTVLKGDQRLLISPKSGDIYLVDNMNTDLGKHCLSPDDHRRLQEILANISVCQMPIEKAEICAARYVPAYASLVFGDNRVSLGEQRDSCGYGRQEICGQQSDIFKSFVSYVRANFTDMSCE